MKIMIVVSMKWKNERINNLILFNVIWFDWFLIKMDMHNDKQKRQMKYGNWYKTMKWGRLTVLHKADRNQ